MVRSSRPGETAPEPVARRLAAIVAADVAGYSRLMGLDEAGTAKALREHRAAVDPIVAAHGGRIVKTTGDGVLLEFPSVVAAVECAVAVQKLMAERNAEVPEDRRMLFRLGINRRRRADPGRRHPGRRCERRGSARRHSGARRHLRLGQCLPAGLGQARRFLRGHGRAATQEHRASRCGSIARGSAALARKDAAAHCRCRIGPSIAVLPFQNMSGDPEQDYFADGMVEDIITALSRFKSLFVIARNSSFTYKGRAVDVKQVGRELGVRYVLEGSVRKAGDRVRITGQLIDTTTVARIFGPIVTMVCLRISLTFKTGSPRAWWAQSRRSWSKQRSNVHDSSRRRASMPMIASYAA